MKTYSFIGGITIALLITAGIGGIVIGIASLTAHISMVSHIAIGLSCVFIVLAAFIGGGNLFD